MKKIILIVFIAGVILVLLNLLAVPEIQNIIALIVLIGSVIYIIVSLVQVAQSGTPQTPATSPTPTPGATTTTTIVKPKIWADYVYPAIKAVVGVIIVFTAGYLLFVEVPKLSDQLIASNPRTEVPYPFPVGHEVENQRTFTSTLKSGQVYSVFEVVTKQKFSIDKLSCPILIRIRSTSEPDPSWQKVDQPNTWKADRLGLLQIKSITNNNQVSLTRQPVSLWLNK